MKGSYLEVVKPKRKTSLNDFRLKINQYFQKGILSTLNPLA